MYCYDSLWTARRAEKYTVIEGTGDVAADRELATVQARKH